MNSKDIQDFERTLDIIIFFFSVGVVYYFMDLMSEEWRRICEATSTLKTNLQQRRKYLALVEKHRGKVAREELETEILKQWKILKGK